MKLYPKDALHRFEFDQIKRKLVAYCNSEAARVLAEDLLPYKNRKELLLRLQQTEELLDIEANQLYFPELVFPGIFKEIKWLSIQGFRLEGDSFLKILHVCEVIKTVYRFLKEKKMDLPSLYKIVEDIDDPNPLIKLIESKIDEKGSVRSSASKRLGDVRKELDSERNKSKRKIETLVKKYKK